MYYCSSNFGNSQPHNFGRTYSRNWLLPPPSGYQPVAKISRHGVLLSPFPSWLWPLSAAYNWSPEGQPQNAVGDRRSWGSFAFQDAKRLLTKAVPLRPFPSGRAFFSHWHLLFSNRRRHAAKIQWSLASPWFFFLGSCLTWSLVIQCLIGSC